MRLKEIVYKIRLAQTSFGNYVAGAAELGSVMQNSLIQEMAFVLPLAENASPHNYDSGINQKLTERFGVVVALKNAIGQKEKTGGITSNRLHDIRSELFRALLGWNIKDAESLVVYRGGRLIDYNSAWFWYMFEFEYDSRIFQVGDTKYAVYDLTEKEVIEWEDIETIIQKIEVEILARGGDDLTQAQKDAIQQMVYNISREEYTVQDFITIYINYILAPSARLPYTGELPLDDSFPNVELPDMAQWLDMTDHPSDGGFSKGFGSGFDWYKD